jgi:hypothetical protein
LYANAFDRQVMRDLRAAMQGLDTGYRPGGDMATIPVERMGSEPEEITTTVELSDEEWAAKQQAFLSHRTQIGPDTIFNRVPPDVRRLWLGTERFILLLPPGAPGNGVEHDLFAGI